MRATFEHTRELMSFSAGLTIRKPRRSESAVRKIARPLRRQNSHRSQTGRVAEKNAFRVLINLYFRGLRIPTTNSEFLTRVNFKPRIL